MHKGGCRDERIALAALVGYMQPGAALCHGGIDRQRAAGKLGQYVLFQPRAQHGPLGRVLALNRQNAKL